MIASASHHGDPPTGLGVAAGASREGCDCGFPKPESGVGRVAEPESRTRSLGAGPAAARPPWCPPSLVPQSSAAPPGRRPPRRARSVWPARSGRGWGRCQVGRTWENAWCILEKCPFSVSESGGAHRYRKRDQTPKSPLGSSLVASRAFKSIPVGPDL